MGGLSVSWKKGCAVLCCGVLCCVQVPPTVDNMLESVVFLTATALGLAPDALLTTHRLDVGTSGIVVLAKTQGFAAWFNTLLKNKPDAIVKTYRCLTAAPPPLGPMVHWALVKERQAGEPAHTRMLLECAVPDADSSGNGNQGGAVAAAAAPVEGAARCELIVEQVRLGLARLALCAAIFAPVSARCQQDSWGKEL
jgi:hypothetical protein